ncbi:MAG: hypothetical protein RL040_78, partial [Bacteroidota bacterium]
ARVQSNEHSVSRPKSTTHAPQNRKPSTLSAVHVPADRKISENPVVVPFKCSTGYATTTQKETNYIALKPAVIRGNDIVNDIWKRKFIPNVQQAKKANRHCGCGGDITFINNTSDTLDIYFRYMTAAETPTIDGVVLPPLVNSCMLAPFYIVPKDSATVRGYCTGGLRYEAVTRNSMTKRDNYLTPRLWLNGSVRMSCMENTIPLEEKAERTFSE